MTRRRNQTTVLSTLRIIELWTPLTGLGTSGFCRERIQESSIEILHYKCNSIIILGLIVRIFSPTILWSAVMESAKAAGGGKESGFSDGPDECLARIVLYELHMSQSKLFGK